MSSLALVSGSSNIATLAMQGELPLNNISNGTWLVIMIVITLVLGWRLIANSSSTNLVKSNPHAELQEDNQPSSAVIAPSLREDLSIIEGIGPKISRILNLHGISTFAQLADTRTERLLDILQKERLRMADPTTWSEQARLAANGDWDELDTLQDGLKGGRRP